MQRKLYDTPQGKMTLKEASKISGIGRNTLYMRIRAGCSAECLFDPPRFGVKLVGLPRKEVRKEERRTGLNGIIIGVDSSYIERWADRKAKKMGATRAP
jgi:predicted DNA-binding transcriptional regulator AlpA